MQSKGPDQPHRMTLVIAGVVTLFGLLIPFVRQILLPVMYLNTHLHELSHAIVARFTGAAVDRIIVNADGSGVTPVAGGSIFLIASAGYVGATLIGALMISMGRTEKNARTMLFVLAIALTLSSIFWVRGDSVGVVSGWGLAILLALAGLILKGKPLLFCCQFLGLQQCLNALTSVFALVNLSTATEVHSDASILQDATGLPAILWALLWSALSIALVVWTFKNAWSPPKRRTL